MLRFFLTLLFLITAVVIFFTQTQPIYNDIRTLTATRDEYQGALNDSRELQSLRDNLMSQYNAIPQTDFDRLGELLPSAIDSGNLIIMLEDRAKEHGLLLKKIDVKEIKEVASDSLGAPPPPYRTIELSFSISGPYASVLSFFGDLEKNIRLIDVKSVSFSSSVVDIYEFNIAAKTYYVPTSALTAGEGVTESQSAKEILSMLTRLRAIKIDTDFFNGDIYKSFIDFLPIVELPKEYGRPNPFTALEVLSPAPAKK